MNAQVDDYFGKLKKWQAELCELRRIILACGLVEDFKWRHPCYTYNGSNVILLGDLKDRCTLSFLKGVLLKDPEHLLEKPGPNTRSAMLLSFKNVETVLNLESEITRFIKDAIAIEKTGLKINFDQTNSLDYPKELEQTFNHNSSFQSAFENLTKGRQRGYLLYFTGAKQSKTRASRIEKYRERIMDGKGMNDCVCGHSKKMPNCDGSHKYFE